MKLKLFFEIEIITEINIKPEQKWKMCFIIVKICKIYSPAASVQNSMKLLLIFWDVVFTYYIVLFFAVKFLYISFHWLAIIC